MSALLEIEVSSERSEAVDILNDLEIMAINLWNQWTTLNVRWPCASKAGTYNVLHGYRDVDILAWFRDSGERDFPTIAALAKIYLGKPTSTTIQDRVFSISGFVVNKLRTRLDDDRAEMMSLMKVYWPEYKKLLSES
jgi:hypothetical protein